MPALTALLLNIAHALDHLFLLIFATAVGAIAADFGFARWEDLMPFTAGAFFMFGLGSVPAGRLGDLWGRRRMMLVFFHGMGLSAIAVALTTNAWQMAAALTVLGAFSAIYHPVGIPMLVQRSTTPGRAIGINGLSGNLGIAVAALTTGFLVQHFGWRAAFAVPGLVSIVLGLWFARVAPAEGAAPARKPVGAVRVLPRALAVRVFVVMVASATTGSLLFNLTTNGNAQLLAERMDGIVADPARLGLLLAVVYAVASVAQVLVGRLVDRMALKPLFLGILAAQVLLFAAAAQASGWLWYELAIGCMVSVFGAIPFNEFMVVRYVDDSMRSRVSGTRIAISFTISSAAVLLLGPAVKAAGFTVLLAALAAVALASLLIVAWLPGERQLGAAWAGGAGSGGR
jgi:MFS family permease